MTFPALMAEFEEDDVFPKTDKCLFLGGPKHGEYCEVVAGDPVHKAIVKAQGPPVLIVGGGTLPTSGAAEVHTYVKRRLGLQADDGEAYERDVYVHEACPNPEVAQQLLMTVLLSEFVKGGRKVVTVDGVSDA